MSTTWQRLSLCALTVAIACSDAPRSTAPLPIDSSPANASIFGPSASTRYVALGTSISMGWASNGVYAGSQIVSWPALLGFGSLRPLSLPLIQSPGCTSPLVAPLSTGLRLSGESGLADGTTCAPLYPGISLPTQNVGIAGALAFDAVATTPETATSPWYARVLPPGTTELAAALGQSPTIVSVEFGANEVLQGLSGLVVPGVTIVPLPFFTQPYDALLDAVGSTHSRAVLVGLLSDPTNLPALRRGDEIWADRSEFAALHVTVSSDCASSPNYVNVSILSVNLVIAGAFTSTHGLPNPVLSCTDVPGTMDLVVTPSDVALVTGLLSQMNDHIRQQATARGYAYFSLDALYGRGDLKPGRYSVISQLSSPLPYGLYTSLDGLHPSPIGHGILALAAAGAINKTYGGFGIHAVTAPERRLLADQVFPALSPGAALEQARQFGLKHQGEQLSPCPLPGDCRITRAMHP